MTLPVTGAVTAVEAIVLHIPHTTGLPVEEATVEAAVDSRVKSCLLSGFSLQCQNEK